MSKQLITDRDVQEGRCGRRIVLDGETLITPSARDRAQRLGIEVVEAGRTSRDAQGGTAYGGAACANCGSTGCSGCTNAECPRAGSAAAPNSRVAGSHAARLGQLADGLWLVRIEGGRQVSALPATGPGQMQRARRPGR